MKNVKKIVCCLLVAVLICVTPLADFVQIEQNVNKAEASEAGLAIGGAALLALILCAYGVTVSDDAMDSVTESFSNWLQSNGSEESRENWLLALSAGTVTLGAKLVADVGSWISSWFPALDSGSVSVVSNSSIHKFGEYSLDVFETLGFEAFISRVNPQYFIFYPGSNTSEKLYIYSYVFDSSTVLVRNNSYQQYYSLSGDTLTRTKYKSYSGYVDLDDSTVRLTYDSDSYGSNFSDYKYIFNIPYIILDTSGSLSSTLSLNSLISISSAYGGFDSVPDAFTSYGGYAQSNVDALPGLVVSSSSISAIIDGVMDAVNANRVEDATGAITWGENVADAVADAYAQGLEDAKANQGALEDSGYKTGVLGWLGKLWGAINALPALIFEAFCISLTGIQETVVSLPQTLTQNLVDVFPSAAYVGELFTTFPAHLVEALTEVFPTSQILTPLITDIPASIVRLLGFDIPADGTLTGTLAGALADVKEAVLAIPASIADVIAGAIADIFVPDLAIAEEQIDDIEESFAWVPQLNHLINDMMLKLEAGDPPTLYLDFTKAEKNKYHGAGKCLAIDFGWYAKYKPTGDLVFGAFLWVLYMWYLFKRLPDIINGAGFITRQSINADNRSNQRKGGNSE